MEFEKLGAFYLGKEYDIKKEELLDRLLMYDSRDLTTHAVCIGMTGSGKTGLCIDLLEEAAIDSVPSILIDPKGDITNLLLTFPELKAEEFRPWINLDDARRKGLSPEEYAKSQAELWKSGLSKWGQSGKRIEKLRETCDFNIYTPGSDAGIPVSIIKSFSAPDIRWEEDAELFNEQVQGTVSALLGLIGIDADPVRSREHILLSNIFEHYWRYGEDLDLPKVILSIQNPPFRKLGVFDIDAFYPDKKRFELAMLLNNLIAAPSFKSWINGQSLDIPNFLTSVKGKPQHSIFYIAHLNEKERMFFVTILLNQLITWMRAQTGTTSLRAILYMDEVFGFFPPVSNPPSKRPLLTILKQARAYGVGAVLTTQNPVDLDYKGLTNAGTWFIGRLQTERDKKRVLDGLESASSAAGVTLKKSDLSKIISGLGKRVFLLHNVHEDGPVTFQTRWAMSYLRGPLTRIQVKKLMRSRKSRFIQEMPKSESLKEKRKVEKIRKSYSRELISSQPIPPPGIDQFSLPLNKSLSGVLLDIENELGRTVDLVDKRIVYKPGIIGAGRIHFTDKRKNIDHSQDFSLFLKISEVKNRWDDGEDISTSPKKFLKRFEEGSYFEDVPRRMNEVKELKALQKDLNDHIYRTKRLTLLYAPELKMNSQPGESERDFRSRIGLNSREERDIAIDKIEKKYENKIRSIEKKITKARMTLEKKMAQSQSRKQELMVSVGESVLGLFLGRRSTRGASTTMRKYRMSRDAKMSKSEVEVKIKTLEKEMMELNKDLKEETDKISSQWDQSKIRLDEVKIGPRKSDIDINVFAFCWMPFWHVKYKIDSTTKQEIVKGFK